MSEFAVASNKEPLIVGRYALFDQLAAGGMATVHLGRLLGPGGFGRTVAVKRLHTHFVNDPEFCTMFMDEARIVARIRHPNVVPMVDVVESQKGLFLVMEYVHGESFSKLLRTARAQKKAVPPKIATAILHGVLLGLHGAHETKGANGDLLDVVHRDVSPQNVMVGADGVARVLDFGIAKAAGRAQVTREGQIKGKLAYMAPEQIRGQVDRRADVFAASVVLWEALAGRRLHEGMKEIDIVTRVVGGKFDAPSAHATDISPDLDAIVLRGLSPDPKTRYTNAREMALELERKVGLASSTEVTLWIEEIAAEALAARSAKVSEMEAASTTLSPSGSIPPDPLFQSGGFPVAPPSSQSLGPPSFVPSLEATSPTYGTPSGTEIPVVIEARKTTPLPIKLGLVACLLLGIVGVLLGGFAIYKRTLEPVAAAAQPPSPAPPPVRAAEPKPIASIMASSSASVTSSLPSSSASARTPTTGTFVAPPPRRDPPPKKPACDPPYTVDEHGHRHYKLECMDPQ